MYPYKILTVFFFKKCIADSMAGGQAKKGNRETRRERERNEDVRSTQVQCVIRFSVVYFFALG